MIFLMKKLVGSGNSEEIEFHNFVQGWQLVSGN
jgi:hypothetical protein